MLAALLAALAAALPVQAASVPLPSSMAATGDSITRAFDVTLGCLLRDCPRYSWSTGSDTTVFSQYQRIAAHNPAITGHVFNDAKSGAQMSDLDRQLTAAAGQHVQYVTVLLGANDLCTSSAASMTPTATFQAQLDQALKDFYRADPAAHLYLSSLPNLYQLWSLLHNNPAAVSTWTAFNICQSMLSVNNTEADRQLVVAQEQAYDQVLASECAKAVSFGRDCLWDNLAGYGYQFTADQISTIDYFHPNIAGQNAVAQVTWSAGYWPGL